MKPFQIRFPNDLPPLKELAGWRLETWTCLKGNHNQRQHLFGFAPVMYVRNLVTQLKELGYTPEENDAIVLTRNGQAGFLLSQKLVELERTESGRIISVRLLSGPDIDEQHQEIERYRKMEARDRFCDHC